MDLYIPLPTRIIRQTASFGPSPARLDFTRGDSAFVNVRFVDNTGTVQELGSGASGTLMLKSVGDYPGEPVVVDTAWAKSGTGASTVYAFEPSYNTNELNKAFVVPAIAEDVANESARFALTDKALGYVTYQEDTGISWELTDIAQIGNADGWTPAPQRSAVDLMFEIEWLVGSVVTSTAPVQARVTNDVIKGNEGAPGNAAVLYYNRGQSDARFASQSDISQTLFAASVFSSGR